MRDRDAAVEERELAQPLRQRVEAELGRLEDLRVGLEGDLGAALLGRAGRLEIGGRRAALVGLLVDLAVAPDLELERLRERVDDRDADAVQTARHLVAVVVELAAGVEHRQDDFGRRLAALVQVDRDAAAVVDDRDRVVDVDRDVDLVAVARPAPRRSSCRRLRRRGDAARRAGRADVHRRALADGLEAFEDLDLVGAVVVRPAAVAVRRLPERPTAVIRRSRRPSASARLRECSVRSIAFIQELALRCASA